MQQQLDGESRVPTLAQVWIDYQKSRHLKETTTRNYDKRLRNHVKDWLLLPVDQITKKMVEERHQSINGNANANSTMRTVRALLFFAAVKYETENGDPVIKINPVTRLSELRAWHKDRRRRTIIPFGQLRKFYKAIWSLENHTARDYMLLLLFTGLRSHEAACLNWSQVNLENGTITILESVSKNGDEHTIPMSKYLWDIMAIRHLNTSSQWVFPGKNRDRHISSIHKSFRAVMARSGIKFCLHDLRRTFVSIADDLEIKDGVVKELVNHRRQDITESYTIRSVERLRRATQRISDAILTLVK